MSLSARPWAAASILIATLLLPAGCFWQSQEDAATQTPASKQRAAQGPAAGQPEAAQKPRPNSEPLFHATNSTGGEKHELEISGSFTVRFACKGDGAAKVSLNAATKYDFTCSPDAPEQSKELVVRDSNAQTYEVTVTTTSGTNTWSLFFDRLRTR